MLRITSRHLCLTLLAGLLPLAAIAAPPQGTWRGLMQQANTDVSLEIRFTPNVAQFRFNEPLSCMVTARFLKEDGDTAIYRFAPSVNGGRFCDSVLNRDVRFTSTDNRLSLVFDGQRSTWRGELRPAPGP